MVIFVFVIGGRRLEGQLVVRLAVSHALLQKGFDVVTAKKGKAPTLGGDYLQGEIPYCHLARLADSLQEALIVKGATHSLRGADRVDVVESHTALSHLRGKLDNERENPVLLLRGEVDTGTGKKRPAGRDPENHLASGQLGFAFDQRSKSTYGKLKAVATLPL